MKPRFGKGGKTVTDASGDLGIGVSNRSKSAGESFGRDKGGVQKPSAWLAALRATAPVLPITASLSTVSTYFTVEENLETTRRTTDYVLGSGTFAVIVGIVAAILAWMAVAFFYRRHANAASASRRNYNLLRERLDRLKSRVEHARSESSESQRSPESDLDTIKNKILDQASKECQVIEEQLESRGMAWVTGLGYIELWHRAHRAEEGLIKIEPCTEAIAGAMRDESRLRHSTMMNRDLLLKRLRCAVAVLDDSETGEDLYYLEEPAKCSLSRQERAAPQNRAKAVTILSEVRYEINHFRDNVWEGIVHARNRLADTAVLLGFVAFVLLSLALFANAPHKAIFWATVYFLVGAIAGLFARAQAEWTADTATDDYGLSAARLVHIPWISGLSAVGGVLVTSVLDSQFVNDQSIATPLADVFTGSAAFLIVAAVFGLTPDLIIRRLTQQTERYKEDLQSTETSQSTETGQSPGARPRR